MERIVDLVQVANVVCQDCNGCDYADCQYDCDFIHVILGLGTDIVTCKHCYSYKNGVCGYYNVIKPETGYCNVGINIEEK